MVFHLETDRLSIPYAELLAHAERLAMGLAHLGVRPRDTVGLLGPNHPEWVRAALAVWLRGAALVPLQHPLILRDPGALTKQVDTVARTAGCRRILTHPRYLDVIPRDLGVAWDAIEERGAHLDAEESGDIAVIQFTSGTTSSPKGSVLTHSAVLHAVRAVIESYEITAGGDVMLSWLPLFHDWGLFNYLLVPIVNSVEAHLIPTERFAVEPLIWFRSIAEASATVTSGPPSSWALALRAADRGATAIDLSSLRVATLGAEMIDPVLVDRLTDFGAQMGLGRTVLGAGYGLAENVLTVTNTSPDKAIRIDTVDATALARGRAEPAQHGPSKRVVGCGRPVPGNEVRVMGSKGPVEERRVGEVQVRSGSLMSGYLGEGPQPFDDGWLKTGDLGYLAEGDLFITGRIKDIVIVHGRNYAAEDLEWAAGRVPGVRAGRSVAFSGPRSDGEIVVVVEPKKDADPAKLPGLVRDAIFDTLGIGTQEVVVAPRGTITKTTSGKLRRGVVRDSYLAGELGPGD